jgi:hypothetical protein
MPEHRATTRPARAERSFQPCFPALRGHTVEAERSLLVAVSSEPARGSVAVGRDTHEHERAGASTRDMIWSE